MEFIREKIKEKPISKKRVVKQLGIAALCGIVFAVTACLVMLLCMPMLQNALLAGVPGNSQQESTGTEEDSNQTQEESETDSKLPSTQRPDIIPDVSLSLEDYQELQNKLYVIGNNANKSIVTVTTVMSETDWMDNSYEIEGQGSGMIVYADTNYYYVLTEKRVIQDATKVRVSFIDGMAADATLLKYDGNTGVTILAVEKRQVSEETAKEISVARFGNSYAVANGTIVIALGSPLGTNYSILTGNITSNSNEIMTLDKNYDVFTTDIVASEKGSGFLINTKGELVGMVIQSFSGSQEMNTLTAVSISDINAVIQRLVQGKDIPYVGLYVSTITKEISETHKLPIGVFIKEVKTDSPAMYAGLQSGDIITQINGEDIYSTATYSSKIQMLLPGTTCEVTVQRQNGDNYMEIKCEVQLGVLQ